jgi:two-component system NtrC family sensor kinase
MGLWQGLSKIRVRLAVGFAAAFLGMALFGVLSYSYFLGMERKLVFLSQADGMVNMVLEARRYEKNYFLYRHDQDYSLALDYLDRYEAMLANDREHLVRDHGEAAIVGLQKLSADYRRQFVWVREHLNGGGGVARMDQAVTKLRASGKELISRLEVLARAERQGITDLLREYRPLLVAFLALLAGLGAVLAYALIARLIRPLQTIEAATEVVAHGDYQTIPRPTHRDEIGSLVNAFNRMVSQLRRNNEQVIQTEKLTALGTLTSGVAHELNNPLNNISTSCQILLEELDRDVDEYHRELLAAIDQQVAKARDIVSSLLEFSRQREFRLRRENLRTVVQESLKLIRGEVPAGIETRLLVPGVIQVRMDKAHMVQALLNLAMNAVQAMGEEGVLTITARLLAQTRRVELVVEDTGPGIPAEVLPRIFDPFFTTKEVGAGTGLGLSIVYGVMERHDGRS